LQLVDHTLINRAKAGDVAAVTAIYECFKPKVYRFFYYRLDDPQAAEDLTTELFLKVIEALPRYHQNGVPFQGWLFQIAHNLTVDHFRRMRVRQHSGLDEEMAADGESPDTAAGRSLVYEQLRHALRRLPEDQCTVVVLRFIASMPVSEVAHLLNRSESAVKALQARGLERLHQLLSQRKEQYEHTR
jgi:RNA polymerase sigma-70 factor (ECF subfamily)